MPGVAYSKFTFEFICFNRSIKRPLQNIIEILPLEYNIYIIEELFKNFYYFEWLYLKEAKEHYDRKDLELEKKRGKKRYWMKTPRDYICSLPQVKRILGAKYIENHKNKFNGDEVSIKIKKLEKKRIPVLEMKKSKIKLAIERGQRVEPIFLDKLMGLYERKNTTQENKMYIILELEKYYCKKTIKFFHKKNDTEINNQLREKAFKHLQSWGHYVKMKREKDIQKKSENKKRKEFLKEEYPFQTCEILGTPGELENRILEKREQHLKKFDYFISHSSKDVEIVKEKKKELNSKGKNIYCDWISDDSYLKRTLVGEATKAVIEKRLEQSNELILIKTEFSLKSNWVKYELNYFYRLNKPIYEYDSNLNKTFQIKEKKPWFYDEKYQKIKLF